MSMKNIPLSLRFIFGFSLVGFLFSGYLSMVKLFSGACAFNETCPTVFGIPACWYGFALYIILLTLVIYSIQKKIAFESGLWSLAGVSLAGVIFAGYLTATELPAFMQRGFAAYTFGVPTCFMGLVFFMLIFLTSTIALSYERERNRS